MPESKRVEKGNPPEPVELSQEFIGLGVVKMYGCPKCGRNGQDRKQVTEHIKLQHGGEA